MKLTKMIINCWHDRYFLSILIFAHDFNREGSDFRPKLSSGDFGGDFGYLFGATFSLFGRGHPPRVEERLAVADHIHFDALLVSKVVE